MWELDYYAYKAPRDFVCAKLDCSNAFPSCSRARVVRVLEGEPTLRHLASHVATTLAAPTILEDRGRRWGEAGEGECAGDPWSAALFCAAWQEQVEELDRELRQEGGMARCLMDDCYSVGPPDTLFPALQRFEASVQAESQSYRGILPVVFIINITMLLRPN